MKTPAATLIRAYLRPELEKLRAFASKGRGSFTVAQIDAEIARRDEIAEKRRDTLIYPELQTLFR